MFFGTYTPRLDDKGRLFLPAKFRDELAEGSWSPGGRSAASTCGPMAEFGRLTERLREAPVTNKAARDYVRMFFAGASDETPGQAGPDHRPADAAGLRVADQGLRRDRRDEPDRDLGRQPRGRPTPTSRSRRSRTCRKRSSPASEHDTARPPPQHHQHTDSTAGVVGRGLASAHRRPSGTPSPVPEATSQRRAGRDLVRRTRLARHRHGQHRARRVDPMTARRATAPDAPRTAPGPARGPRRARRGRVLGRRLHRRSRWPCCCSSRVAG